MTFWGMHDKIALETAAQPGRVLTLNDVFVLKKAERLIGELQREVEKLRAGKARQEAPLDAFWRQG